jgi:hypothetical protein
MRGARMTLERNQRRIPIQPRFVALRFLGLQGLDEFEDLHVGMSPVFVRASPGESPRWLLRKMRFRLLDRRVIPYPAPADSVRGGCSMLQPRIPRYLLERLGNLRRMEGTAETSRRNASLLYKG